MVVQESLIFGHSQNNHFEDADETLSLSDLPLYGDQISEEEDTSDESQAGSRSVSSSEQDYFEFFSHQLTATFPPENFIFCGKIIPYKKPVTSTEHVLPEVVEDKSIKKTRGFWGVFGWKFGSKSTTLVQEKKYNTEKLRKGNEIPVDKMGILTSTSSGKARWYFFLSGISRFSNEMELRDIRSRQSRRSPPPSPVVNHHDDGGRNRGLSRLWRLIKVLSCENHHPNAMAVGSIMRLE